MWNDIINIHPSELLSTKTKEFRINESCKKKKKKKCFTILKKKNKNKNMDNLHFIPNNIRTKYFKELTKYKNNFNNI